MNSQISEIAAVPDESSFPSTIFDSASLSCYAATELDQLLLRGTESLENVKHFISFIENQVSEPKLERNPETIMALNWAFVDSNLLRPSIDTTIQDLFNEAGKITGSLRDVIKRPSYYRNTEAERLESLRDFCLFLSKRFAANEPFSLLDEPTYSETQE